MLKASHINAVDWIDIWDKLQLEQQKTDKRSWKGVLGWCKSCGSRDGVMGVIKETAKKTEIDREQLDLAVHVLALAINPKMRNLTASRLVEMKEWEFLARILLDDLRLIVSLEHDVPGDVCGDE